jgi:hypothetical protein
MLFKEIIAVYGKNHTKHITTKCSVTDYESRWNIYLPLGLKGLMVGFLCVRLLQMKAALLYGLLLVSWVTAWNDGLRYWSYGRGYGRGHYGTPYYNYWDDTERNVGPYPCSYPWCTYGVNLQFY